MASEPRVTDADRQAACDLLGYKDWGDATDYRNSGRTLDAVGRAARAFAKHRQAALIEGVRLGIEAAGQVCSSYVTFCGKQPFWPDRHRA